MRHGLSRASWSGVRGWIKAVARITSGPKNLAGKKSFIGGAECSFFVQELEKQPLSHKKWVVRCVVSLFWWNALAQPSLSAACVGSHVLFADLAECYLVPSWTMRFAWKSKAWRITNYTISFLPAAPIAAPTALPTDPASRLYLIPSRRVIFKPTLYRVHWSFAFPHDVSNLKSDD